MIQRTAAKRMKMLVLSERSEARFALDGIRDGLGVIPGEIVPDSWS
jgi:hypothetical protein